MPAPEASVREDAAPAEDMPLIEDAAPAEGVPPIEDAELVEDVPPLEDTLVERDAAPTEDAVVHRQLGASAGADARLVAVTVIQWHKKPKTKASPRRRLTWAALMMRVFGVDVLRCPTCEGRMRIIAR